MRQPRPLLHQGRPYRGAVRKWRVLCWWGLLAVLVLSVVVMHHAPMHGTSKTAAPASTAAAVPASPGTPHSPHGHNPNEPQIAPATATGQEHLQAPSGHGLLHLCLAILAGLALLLVAAKGILLPAPPARAGPRMPTALGWLAPPVPVPRRLATLCVLRL